MNRNDQQFMAQKIRTQYMEKQATALDELRTLDAKVKRPANVFAYIFGSISAIIMGFGMSLIMTDLKEILGSHRDMALIIGIIIGFVGMIGVIVAYPLYQSITAKERKKVASEILRLTDALLNM